VLLPVFLRHFKPAMDELSAIQNNAIEGTVKFGNKFKISSNILLLLLLLLLLFRNITREMRIWMKSNVSDRQRL
jgi:H+/gluconate symporter-like permease